MELERKFSVLIVDDERTNIELASAYLQDEPNYIIYEATDALSAMKKVHQFSIDIILLDINMPNQDGFEVCQLLKSDPKTVDIPVVFLTAQVDIEYISKAFEVGGVDYINKPFNGIELKARVKTHLQSRFYLQELKEKQLKLAQLTVTDPLTKLYNTFYFDTQIKSRQMKKSEFWILYIKINNFEKINTLYSFSKANQILVKFSEFILKFVPSNSIVARLHGTSFGVLLNNSEKVEIQNLSNAMSVEFINKKELSSEINYTVVAYYIDKSIPTINIYKKLQLKTQSTSSVNNIVFVK